MIMFNATLVKSIPHNYIGNNGRYICTKSDSSGWMCVIFNTEDKFLDVERLQSKMNVRPNVKSISWAKRPHSYQESD